MRTRELVRKDLAELLAARSWWLLLLVLGALTGQAFITAVRSYAEMSAPNALAQGLSPLDGIVVPTLGAYDLALTLLFPFVAIRLVANERATDALKLILQWPVTRAQIVFAKVVALLAAWLVSLVPFAIALALWAGYGGHLSATEVVNVLTGYTLRFLLTVSLAMIAAALLPGAANAAVAVLALTIGTWALDFVATGRGGVLQRLAGYTPAAALRSFERGLFRVDVALVLFLLALTGFALTAIWLDLGATLRRRLTKTAVTLVASALLLTASANVSTSFDFSENRRNSFAPGEVRALGNIGEPLTMTVWLSSEDPRLADLENSVLVRLRRAMHVKVVYPLEGRTGLFENDDRYGTIEYALGEKRTVNRSTTEAIVLETIFSLAGEAPASTEKEEAYPGYPLRAQPRGAGWIFYCVWPAATLLLALLRNRRTG